MNNITIALAIANSAIIGHNSLRVEEVNHEWAPYEGVVIFDSAKAGKVIHIYLVDDEPGKEEWLVDTCDEEANVNPLPLTGANLSAAIQFILN